MAEVAAVAQEHEDAIGLAEARQPALEIDAVGRERSGDRQVGCLLERGGAQVASLEAP